ncbi:hypothetical protein [Solicola gregarius]|uniref:Methyltransferase type 12 n=1 Tax=Solicola gregarius TaxID=2908642 RepID=A0AA46TGG6_9ACTN|nr:hypothetical protein [Solicola gregarius]UYM04700.1 hypothetical protein L0C25_19510 [Solicola gregarius]
MTHHDPLQKADFGAIYDQPDPRAYFSTLQPFGYVIPQYGADAFTRLLSVLPIRDVSPTVLDVCSSYGIVGTLLRSDLRLSDLYAHYTDPTTSAQSPQTLREADRKLIAERAKGAAPRVVGLDVAPNAVAYGVEIGAIDAGVTDNLETDDPSGRLTELLAGVDLITTTGGVGYVTERTFDRLLRSCPKDVWVAAFCLRTYDYHPIATTLARHGLRTERMSRTFPQRRFTDEDERQWAISRVRERGLDPEGKEADGYYHADLYLSRPLDATETRHVDALLADAF